ncbi:MAG: hypothetical protein K0R28_6930, partial [Paenibacillus sp.]|nr:hypothetical protein [Paenibacillus sp.]
GFTYSLNVFTVFQIAIPAVLFIALVLRRDRAGAIPDR